VGRGVGKKKKRGGVGLCLAVFTRSEEGRLQAAPNLKVQGELGEERWSLLTWSIWCVCLMLGEGSETWRGGVKGYGDKALTLAQRSPR